MQKVNTRLLFTIILFIASFVTKAQSNNSKYDKALADSVGADEYGMKMYVLVILKTGPTQITDKTKRDSIFKGHLNNIKRLASEGKMVVAGPMQENDKKYEGIFILNVRTTNEAKVLLDTDPAIKAGALDTELYGWYGSAALPLYLPFHDKVQKTSF